MIVISIIGIILAIAIPNYRYATGNYQKPAVIKLQQKIGSFDYGKIIKIEVSVIDKLPYKCILEDRYGNRVKAYINDEPIMPDDEWSVKIEGNQIVLNERIR